MINLLFIFSFLYWFDTYIVKNYKVGMDERIYFYPNKNNITTIYKILKIQENIENLWFLESKSVSIDDKLFEIDKNVPQKMSMYNGGLYNDWHFNFEE